jgi:Tfp pilus assembly protein PilN
MALVSDFLVEKLGVAVETLNPLRCVKVSDGVDQSHLHRLAPLMAEHVGLALRSNLSCPLAFDLMPPSVGVAKTQKQQVLAIAFAGVAICAPLLAWGYHLSNSAALANKLIERQKPKVDKLTKLDKQIKASQSEIQSVIEKAKPLELISRDRQYWTMLVNHIHSKLPDEKVWITSFEIPPPESATKPSGGLRGKANTPATPEKKDPRERLVLKGLYLENPKGIAVVEEFGKALQNSDLYDVAPEQEWTRNNVVNPTEWAQEFAIPLYLKSAPASSVNAQP